MLAKAQEGQEAGDNEFIKFQPSIETMQKGLRSCRFSDLRRPVAERKL